MRCSLVLGLALLVSGCVEVDGELRADGALSFRYTYDPPSHATVASEHARLTSPHVRIEHLEREQSMDGYPPQEFVTATLVVDDVTKLSTAPAFAAVRVALDRAKGELRLTLPGLERQARDRVRTAPDGGTRRAAKLSFVLPGPAQGAEPAATIDGRRVTWTLSLREYAALGDTVTLTTFWAVPAAPPSHSM
jgi:hypothetical protein